MNSLKYLLSIAFGLLSLFSHAQDKPTVEVGGALRFNYNYSTWKPAQKKRGGDFGYDVFRINAKAAYKQVTLNTEFRIYAKDFGGPMLKQGWIGYNFNETDNLQIGLTQVPFGITQYNSNSWFFSLNYYVGLEDDHDMGVKYTHTGDKWDYSLAFFKNAEELRFGNSTDVSDSRYSYDVASIDLDGDGSMNLRNKEVNQLNGDLTYKILSEDLQQRLGVSAQYGGLFNLDTENMGGHYAFAAHYELKAKKFGLKGQFATYGYNPKNPVGETRDVMAMTAYGAPYLVASRANIYSLGLSYSIPLSWGPISNVVIYNDLGYMHKLKKSFDPSVMNVTGGMFTAGSVYTYVDFAAGKNQPWLGPVWTNALGSGGIQHQNTEFLKGWDMRFNINIGYYF